MLDGYVHGAYPHSMELYNPVARRWALQGTLGSPYPASMQRQHSLYLSRAMSLFAGVCVGIGEQALCDRVVESRRRFESSSEYASDGPAAA